MRSEHQRTSITPSVLDRLLDEKPKEQVEGHNPFYFDLNRLETSSCARP